MSDKIKVEIEVPKPPDGFVIVGPGTAQYMDMMLVCGGWHMANIGYFNGCLARRQPKKQVVRPFTREDLADAIPITVTNESGDVWIVTSNDISDVLFTRWKYYSGPHKGLPVGKVVEE